MLNTQDIEQIQNSPEGEGVRVVSADPTNYMSVAEDYMGEVFRTMEVYNRDGNGPILVEVFNKFGGDPLYFKFTELELTIRRDA